MFAHKPLDYGVFIIPNWLAILNKYLLNKWTFLRIIKFFNLQILNECFSSSYNIWWFVCQPNFYLGWSNHSTLVTMKTGSGRWWNHYRLRPTACHHWFDKNRAPWGPTNCLIRFQPVQCCDPTIAISIKSMNYCANSPEEMCDCRTVAHRKSHTLMVSHHPTQAL